jgi:PAS domain S-box-containing protein
MNENLRNFGRKKAEEAVFRDIDDWKHTFDAVPDLIAILDTEFRIVRANNSMAASLGMTSTEYIGLTCYRVVHGTDEPPFFCPDRQLLSDGLEHTVEIYEDSLGGYFIVSVSPLHDSKGKLAGCIHVARNINERREAEETLKKAYDNLDKLVKERTNQLEKAYNSLKESEKNLLKLKKCLILGIGNWIL